MNDHRRAAELIADPADLSGWSSVHCSDFLLGRKQAENAPSITAPGFDTKLIPTHEVIKTCGARLLKVRDCLRKAWVGLSDSENGPLTDWLLAAAIARENPLLLGSPGVAKSEISVFLFRELGLEAPKDQMDRASLDLDWHTREQYEREQQKYFHYLLNKFTQLEELFGPIEIAWLRKGVMARVNHGLMTGPGVRAAFLDELFKASPNVLNALLTLLMERRFFNWGGMRDSDLIITIAASNEMPGESASQFGVSTEEFTSLYPFLDRFALRINVPLADGRSNSRAADRTQYPVEPADSDLAQAFDIAMNRETARFCQGDVAISEQAKPESCVNDVLLAGRVCLQQQVRRNGEEPQPLYRPFLLEEFRRVFLDIAVHLQQDNTHPALGQIRWTISPRKLRSLYKIALAHAFINADAYLTDPVGDTEVMGIGQRQLRVFTMIWDSKTAQTELHNKVDEHIGKYALDLPAGHAEKDI